MSCGVLHKRILLPACNYSSDEIRCILLHEASHIKNRDPLLQLLTNILCAVYWWNPLVYLLRTDMWHAFELRCDRDVIKSIGYDQITIYLKTLVSVLENTDNNDLQNQVTGVLGLNRDLKLIKERVLFSEKLYLHKHYISDAIVVFIAIFLMICSYSVIFQSAFSISNIDEEILPQESYIIQKTNGNYEIEMPDGNIITLNKDDIPMLTNDGFNIVKEDDDL